MEHRSNVLELCGDILSAANVDETTRFFGLKINSEKDLLAKP